jgi:hypothetical protein
MSRDDVDAAACSGTLGSMEVPDPHQVARERLAWATSDTRAAELMQEILAEIGVTHLATVDDLRRFGEALLGHGEVGRTVGSLLILHCGRVEAP